MSPGPVMMARARSAPITVSGGGAPADGLYFMSNEVPFADSVLTDDFRRMSWVTGLGGDYSVVPGWINNSGKYGDPAGQARNLTAIGKNPLFNTSDWVADTGEYDSTKCMATHRLSGGGSGGYSQMYLRFYTFFVPANYFGAGNPSADYIFGDQKFGSVNRWIDDSGIFWGGLGLNVATDAQHSTGDLKFVNNHAFPNESVFSANYDLVPGNWYYVESFHKLNTGTSANGEWKIWVNDGGPTGDFGGQTPTLRNSYTNMLYSNDMSQEDELIGSHWFENWTNPTRPSVGRQFWANIHIRTDAQVGFVP